ncbi:sigma-70 family RNA polymerase sigma factor [Pseudenhygromyxa sp. WMMC2535]|uniref:sigma-70 family RNA polymerase sigma factor n=1 Tax=Pseudenhygromyxa sp. WMMC2535 TaxID=2712867 RepID=UPI001553B450|nr:sigma-70 family RNA polymerase sigma factor [Pseudenhygromyxa sp. WMMC2535]NVB40900.1 sigma-70 family RNA polymerase sigma factor [Pseudenhygromyxa sp. WMMC2535]
MSPPLSEDQAARAERHAELVKRVARSVSRWSSTLGVDELESVGNEALVRAAMRYDPGQEASFSTFAYYRVRGAMIDAIRKRTPARRKQKRALVRLEATQALLGNAAEDQAARQAAGERATLEQRVAAARELVRRATLAVCMSETSGAAVDHVAAGEPDPEQALVDADRLVWLRTMVDELDAEERALIDAIYVRGYTMKDYAKELGMNASTISRRHARLLARLAKRARTLED